MSNLAYIPPKFQCPHCRMRFRSLTELTMHDQLTQMNIAHSAMPVVARGYWDEEPDFLIFQGTRWGVLEIDGPWHDEMTKAREDLRHAWFREIGAEWYQHVPVGAVDEDPRGVAIGFMRRLRRAA